MDYGAGRVAVKELVAALVAAAAAGCLGPTLPLPQETTPAGTAAEPAPRSTRPARAFAITRATDLLDGALRGNGPRDTA